MIEVREAQLPDDARAIAGVDTAFTTEIVFDIEASDRAFALRERRLATPLTKRFPLDDLDEPQRPWSHGFIAEEDGGCLGFAAAQFQAWNKRLVLWHLYVDPTARRRGVARSLIERVDAMGRGLGARHIWLETTNLNAPGVAAYRALGFQLSGFDLTLYDGTPAEGEIALFFSRPISG